MAHCAKCRSSNLVTVTMTLAKAPVLFTHCRACEHRWWTDVEGGQSIPLRDVLERAGA